MRNALTLVLVAALLVCGGCAKGMVTASAIKPAVDRIVPVYIEKLDPNDRLYADKKAEAELLKETVDLAAGGAE